jgi:VWFA-related protein
MFNVRPNRINALAIILVAASFTAGLPALLSGQQSSSAPPIAATQGSATPEAAKQSNPPQQTAPPVRVSTRLVQVSVIVEEHGQPIAGLKQEDFALFDQGQPQQIAFFSEHSSSADASGAAAAPLLPPDMFTNRMAEKPGVPPSVTVILLDLLNTHSSDMAYARNQIVKFIEALQPQDRVALYGLSDQLYILHDFTRDSSALLAALNHYKNTENFKVSGSEVDASDTGDDQLDAFLDTTAQKFSDFYTISRVEETASALEAIGNHLAALPGRKNLVWVSSSFPFEIGYDAPTTVGDTSEHRTFSAEIEGAARALNNANVAVYPVDARGLVAGAAKPTLSMSNRSATRPPRGPGAISSPPTATLQTMDVIADRTGGRAFYNTNDLKGAVRRAIDDSRVTYTIGYYPTHGTWDGRFREIKLELKHAHGEMRYRKGYFAFPGGTPDIKAQKKVLADVSSTPLDDTEFGLTLRADPVPPAPAASAATAPATRKLATRLRFDATQMHFEQKDGRYFDKVDVQFLQLGANGKPVKTDGQTVDLNLLPESYKKVMTGGIILNSALDIHAECTSLRVVARDQGSGVIGSLNVPMKKVFSQPAAAPGQQK